jgi:hypothetical protein
MAHATHVTIVPCWCHAPKYWGLTIKKCAHCYYSYTCFVGQAQHVFRLYQLLYQPWHGWPDTWQRLRYNSPDCPVHQRSNCSFAQRSTAKAEEWDEQWRTVRAESEPPIRGAPDFPVPLEDKASNGHKLPNPNGWVTWLTHRTVRCIHRQQPPPTACWWLRAINTSQPPPLQASKFSELLIQYKS